MPRTITYSTERFDLGDSQLEFSWVDYVTKDAAGVETQLEFDLTVSELPKPNNIGL